MDNGGSNGGGSFEVEHGNYAAEVTNVHEAGAREVRYVVREGEMWIKGYKNDNNLLLLQFKLTHQILSTIIIHSMNG